VTKDEFVRILRKCRGKLTLVFEEREDYGVIVCLAAHYCPLTAKLDGKWSNIADFKHKGKGFVVKYYKNKEKRDEIAKDLAYFEAILSGFNHKKKGKEHANQATSSPVQPSDR